MTLSGREAPSTRRIDVEANLLEGWLGERQRMRREIQLRIVGIAGIAILGFWGTSEVNRWRAGIAVKEQPVQQRLRAIQAQFAKVVPTNSGTPEADIEKMVATSKTHADAYMAQIIALLNTSSSSMAISSLKADVLGGEVKLTGQADAETYYAASQFIQQNNDPTKGMNAAQLSTTRSDLLATDGVSFQFVKKARVAQ
ncbi:MAG TPA: hypothetical protein VHE55_02330 [Fimbriimonadaceae bacterium]|nr:hypothetical protein [Fimbriimonadaceae bacterium]